MIPLQVWDINLLPLVRSKIWMAFRIPHLITFQILIGPCWTFNFHVNRSSLIQPFSHIGRMCGL